ncbi:MAG: TlpA family protein disulfide reductase [Gemmatimonadetes bacterium]|nr:TlpA family protein disulfide reductase [Gemmatimonadota bacterium]
MRNEGVTGYGRSASRRVQWSFVTTLITVLTLGAAAPATGQDVGLPLGTVPDAVQLEDLDGNAVDLATVVGRKPVLIEFWATWCPLCEALEPRLEAAKKEHGDALEILIVAVGVNQTPRSIRRHVDRHTPPGRLLFDGRGRAARAYKAPTTSYVVALNARGQVVYTGVGDNQDIAGAARKAVGK